jgi:apolipoprotein N-acyltransferase
VGLGQPAWCSFFGPIAAIAGYAFFWMSLDYIEKSKNRFSMSFIWYFTVQLVQLSWMPSTKYQGFYIILVYLLICVMLGLQFAFLTKFLFMKNLSKFTSSLSVAAMAVLLEWSRLFVFCGFSFNFFGMALAWSVLSMQLVSVFGVLGLSFFVILTNCEVYRFCKMGFPVKNCVLFLLLAATPYLFGWMSFSLENKKTGNPVRVLLVQTGLSPSEKLPMTQFIQDFISPYKQWEVVFSLCNRYKNQKMDLIILPENAVGFGMDQCIYSYERMKKICDVIDADMCKSFPALSYPYGVYKNGNWFVSNAFWVKTLSNYTQSEVIAGFDHTDQASRRHYNAAFGFSNDKDTFQRYEKQILLPLAEMLPFKHLRRLTEMYGISEFFTPGSEPKLLAGDLKVGVSICVEETFPEIMRQFKLSGAQMLANITNDGWYPATNLPLQHFSHSRLRAVENGLPLVRACNTGVTSIIDHKGRLLSMLQFDSWKEKAAPSALYGVVNVKSSFALYPLWGDAGIVFLSLLILALKIKIRENQSVF